MNIQFTLNGQKINTQIDENLSLLQYLRGVACLKGSKLGCNTGHCGACTVLLNNKPIRSCLFKMKFVQGKDITTIEGLNSAKGKLHPIQQAFLDTGAVQCGFCTPGMILATKALLDKNHAPSIDEIKKALSHNYCRCTGYVKIIKAVKLAAQRMYPKEVIIEEPSNIESCVETLDTLSLDKKVIGNRINDIDGNQKVCGQLEFADDKTMPNLLYARPVWGIIPHGTIISMDFSEAEKIPGVKAIFTAKDIPGINDFGMVMPDQPVFCEHEINFSYDLLALAVAETVEIAEKASKLVKVTTKELKGIFTINEALIHNSILKEITHSQGDLQKAKAKKDLLVLKRHFDTTWVEHAYLEPESVLAYTTDCNNIVIQTPTQAPFELRKQIAAVLALDTNKVRIVVTPLGGGFGGKGDATMQPAVALASYLLKQPVKLTLTREESLGRSTKKHPYSMDYEIGITKDGIISYVDADLLSDGGAYADLSPRVIDQSCIFAIGPYKIHAGKVRGRCVKTNNVLSSAMRGFGINQVSFAMESLLDEASRILNIDPFVLRERNVFSQGDMTFSGEFLYGSIGIKETITQCKSILNMLLSKYKEQYPKDSKVLGVGMASCFKNVGAGKGRVDNAGATVSKDKKGNITLSVSGVDMGQGFRTAMYMIASEVLGTNNITIVNGDTDNTDPHGSAVGERQTLVSGMAVKKACELFLEEGKNKSSKEAYSVNYYHTAPRTFSLDDKESRKTVPPEQYKNYPAYAYATQAVIIEVDRATGVVKVLESIIANDTGKIINPMILEGQIEGCCSMGIGYTLSEHFDMEKGKVLSKTYGSLGVPTINTTPNYHILLIENPELGGPFGAKGISEIGTVPITAAITNAIYDAVGIRVTSLPITPNLLKKQIEESARKKVVSNSSFIN